MALQCHCGLCSTTLPLGILDFTTSSAGGEALLSDGFVGVCCCTFESVTLRCSWEAVCLSHCLLCLINSSASLSSRSNPCHEQSPNGLQNGSEKKFKSEGSWTAVLMCSFNTAPSGVWARTSWSSSLEESVMRSPSASLYCNWRSFPSPRLGKRPVSLSFSWSNVSSEVTRKLRVS